MRWVEANPSSVVSLYQIYTMLSGQQIRPGDAYTLFKNSPASLAENNIYKHLSEVLRVEKITEVGKKAPVFSQADSLGKTVSVEDFKGKYLLVDFWASWCKPCRKENPNLVNAYTRFKSKGLEILGVSLDNNKAAWLKSIKEDGLTWVQVSDLKGWRNAVAVQYGVNSIPFNMLLDANGVIVAKNLGGDELEYRLAEILGQ